MKRLFPFFALLCAPLCGFVINVGSYGWLDQYSLNEENNFIGDEACVPTASTNAMTYLQNTSPSVFGSTLTGSSYADWVATDDFLIELMNTQPFDGTDFYQLVYGLNEYITQIHGYSQVRFSGMFPDDTWFPSGGFPKPDYITAGKPTIEFLTTALAGGSAALLSIEYPDNEGGHEVLANGLVWNTETQTGSIYFVDPLDPSQNYSPETPLGPTKQTVGSIRQDGDRLVITYNQYAGQLPYTGVYNEDVSVEIFGVYSIGGAAFTPFALLLPNGNLHAVAKGFDALDPTTAEMFPTLAVFNLLSQNQLESTFNQLDPSIFNAILFAEQWTAQQTLSAVRNNLLRYKYGACASSAQGSSCWYHPFRAYVKQDGSHVSSARSGYKNHVEGAAAGLDYLGQDRLVVGAGLSYANSTVQWDTHQARAKAKSYGAFLYGALVNSSIWIEASAAYFYNRVKATREVFSPSQFSFIAPVNLIIEHQSPSNLFAAHTGLHYEWMHFFSLHGQTTLWPYFNLDYFYAHQPSFQETGGGVLGLKVAKKSSQLLQPEVGLGLSCSFQSQAPLIPFLQATLGYAKEFRFGGRQTHASFLGSPGSAFTVSGLFPQNHLIRPLLTIGLASPSDSLRIQFNYQGAFSSGYSSNEVAGEFSLSY